ncbi:hypothetical protein ACVWXN_000287 [Bradyrhizobium sp. i1.4.4]|uniref:Pilus assembly protein PilZ n=1 Tax=Bradyrhizobium japonicum TaxID=375 RepID=A0A1Y2JR07_BRAJP|nr:pilus assembly protein PilZ [Bradyrhizobium japonicum]OSJ33881.1 pilus assembly protein PilZ [Bradyrhizobium japonicum]
MPHAKEVPPVTFEIPLPAQMMAIDGTWRRPCAVKTISDTGATIFLEASIEGLSLTEFFLVLSSTGLAYRRCEVDGVNGTELSVKFLRTKGEKNAGRTDAIA